MTPRSCNRLMTRRIAAGLASITAALALAVALATSAHAARGVLTINGTWYPDPSGCVNGIGYPNYDVDNQTDQTAKIIDGVRCRGDVVKLVPPGESASGSSLPTGYSLYIP